VTLEGEKSDWQNILSRLEKLKEYGDETTAWYKLLFPVVSRFVTAFENPNSKENLDFWQKVVHYQSEGSGTSWLAGWINAFCVFDSKGNWKGYPVGLGHPSPPVDPYHYLILDDVTYHQTSSAEIPQGFAEVHVELDDNGEKFDTTLVAGLVGTLICDSGDKSPSKEGKRDTAKPFSAWWIFAQASESEQTKKGKKEFLDKSCVCV